MFKKKTRYLPEKYWVNKEREKNSIIIHHYCPHTFNVGDHFVILSIRKHLKKYLPEAVFVPKAIAGNRGWGKPIGLKDSNIYYSNKYADAVIIGGSDQYNDWSPKIEAEEIKYLKPSLFLIGLGASSKDIASEAYLSKRKYKYDILATNYKALLSSVRDEASNNFLKRLGYNKAVVTGCPALFLFDEKIHYNSSDASIILVFPYPLIRTKNRVHTYHILIDLMKSIMSRFNENFIIVCHDDRDVAAAQEIFPSQRIFYSNYPQDYFELYKKAKMVIGSRLHAAILAISLGIPSININIDLRGVAYSDTFKLSKWNIDYNDPELKLKITEGITRILDKDLSPFQEFAHVQKKYRVIFYNFMKECARLIKTNF